MLVALATANWPTTLFAVDNHSVSASKISLPSGPGSIEGLGESFEPQLNTGTYSVGLPLKLPAVRGAIQAQVRLAYNSGSGNGPLGLGWRLDVPGLQRQTDKGLPNYTTNDTFVDFWGEELVRLADGAFRAENETDFTKWENLSLNGWRATRRDGSILRFGQTAQARQDHPTLGTFKWMLESAQDLNGNRVEYSYVKDGGQIYVGAVEYGRHATLPSSFYRLSFQYQTNRPDCLTDYRGRFPCQTRLRLAGAILEFEGRRLRFWRLGYLTNSPLSLLGSFTQFGDERSNTSTNALLNTDYLPPVSYEYSLPAFGSGRQWMDVGPFANVSLAQREADLVDLNRDGLQDVLLYDSGKYYSYLNRGPGQLFGSAQQFSSSGSYPPLDLNTTKLADLRGDGSVKVLVEDNGSYYYRAFTSATTLGTDLDYLVPGSFSISDPAVQVVDIDNDRALDFVAADTGDSTFAMVLSRSGAGSAATRKSPPTALAMNVRFADGWQFSDMNGDRMPDLVAISTVEEGGTLFYPGKGYGEFDAAQVMMGGPRDADLGTRGRQGLTMADLDLDGLGDLVLVDSGVVKVWANRSGKEWSAPVSLNDPEIPDYIEGSTAVHFADMNGNGSVDIVWNDPGQGLFLRYLDLHPGTKPNVMIGMANGMGRTLGIEYRTSTDFILAAAGTSNAWTVVPPFPVPVVSAFTERDGLGSTYRTEVMYRNGYYDPMEREFRGFETAIRRELGNDSQGAPTLVTEYRFDTGAMVEALKGKPLQVERRTVSGEIFDRVSTVWTNRQLPLALATNETRRVSFAFHSTERSEAIEKGIATPAILLREFEWDDYGNQTRVADYGRVEGANRSAWDDERVVTRTFTAAFPDGLARWILGLPVTETITDENSNVVTRTESFYDDETFDISALGRVQRGNLTLQRRLVDPQTAYMINQVRNRYDGYGNVMEIYDPLGVPGNFNIGHVRQIDYDPGLRTYPVSETIHVGGISSPLIARATYDIGLAVMISSADFNTNRSFYHYDTFGRIVSITKPGDTTNAPTEFYAYQLGIGISTNRIINYIGASRRETAGGGTLDSRVFFDGLGRKVMVRSEGEAPGQTVVTDTVVYNDRRGVWKKFLPCFDTGGLSWNVPTFVSGFVENHYDAMGRPIRTYQPAVGGERVFAETTYEPLARLSKDEEQTCTNSIHFGSAMRHIEDGLRNDDGAGRLRQVQEIVKLMDSGEIMDTPTAWTTSYEYGLLDQLTRITDAQNNIKILQYDGLKRKTFMNDPDRGISTYAYDDASNLLETFDAKGQQIRFTYDGANRLLAETYVGSGLSPRLGEDRGEGAVNVAYHYDAPSGPVDNGDGTKSTAQNTRGMLAFVSDASGEEHTCYDARARVQYVIKRIPDPQFLSLSASGGENQGEVVLVSYKTLFDYDSLDRVTRMVYPDNDQVTYVYNSRSLLERIIGGPSGSILSNLVYLPSGQQQHINYGNGVRTTYAYDPRLRLNSLLTHHASRITEPLISFGYDFDGVSNIKSIADLRPTSAVPAADRRRNTQTFTYDDLYRLTRVQYNLPNPSPTNSGQINYRYDRIGNMLAQSSDIAHFEKGLSVTDLGTMNYGGTAGKSGRLGRQPNDPPGPHALTSTRNSKLETRNYPYDANGNMTNIDGLICTWDFKDRLVSVEDDTMRANYTYDCTGRRITKLVDYKPGGATNITHHASRITTLYVGKHFEIRENEAPTKYVFNGETRVAAITGSLSANNRIQRLRLYPGWNLCALAVAVSDALSQISNRQFPIEALKWNSTARNWQPLAANENLSSGTVLSIYSVTNAILALMGPYSDPVPTTLSPGDHFISASGLETWFPSLPSTLSAWHLPAGLNQWQANLSSDVAFLSTTHTFPTLPPGIPVFLRSPVPVELEIPEPSLRLRYYHQDHLGSSSIITDAQGALVEESAFYPFGISRHEYRLRQVEERYKFTEKEQDGESGLHYFEARYMAGRLSRFVGTDSKYTGPEALSKKEMAEFAGHPQMINSYSYVRNNPLSYNDSSGLEGRPLFDEERKLAKRVFGCSIDLDKVTIVNKSGFQGRAYTVGHTIFMGEKQFNGTNPNDLIHELVHVWQSENETWEASYFLRAGGRQILATITDASTFFIGKLLGKEISIYDPYELDRSEVGKLPWSTFNPEEQAHIIEDWYLSGERTSDPAYRYVKENLRQGIENTQKDKDWLRDAAKRILE